MTPASRLGDWEAPKNRCEVNLGPETPYFNAYDWSPTLQCHRPPRPSRLAVLPLVLVSIVTTTAIVGRASAGDATQRDLTSAAAEQLAESLWQQHVSDREDTLARMLAAKELTVKDRTMPIWYEVYGQPADGKKRSLFISMHGGGSAPARVNDGQWRNQQRLYRPAEGVYVAPRAPTDAWNMWHQAPIDDLFDLLIEAMVVVENVDPDRVYLLGYSAGGDGVYQLAPRMADRFAAAAMMAGHPNETQPDGLRNLPFALHMGERDRAYDRNKIAVQWKEKLAGLAAGDPGGYPHQVTIHAGKGHWMDREDAVAIDWMQAHRRNLRPEKIVWLQDDVTHARFYWLAVDSPQPRKRVVAERDGNTIRILEGGEHGVAIRLDDAMVDLDQPVTVTRGAEIVWQGVAERRREVLRKTLAERADPQGMFSAEIVIPPADASSEATDGD